MYFDHKISCFVKGRFAFRPVEEEGDSPIFANFRDSSYFGILSKVCFKDWLNDQAESGKNQFLGQEWDQKSQNCPISISPEQLVVESLLTTQNDRKTWFTMGGLRCVYPWDNRNFPKNTIVCIFGPYNDEIAWFSVSREPPVA